MQTSVVTVPTYPWIVIKSVISTVHKTISLKNISICVLTASFKLCSISVCQNVRVQQIQRREIFPFFS